MRSVMAPEEAGRRRRAAYARDAKVISVRRKIVRDTPEHRAKRAARRVSATAYAKERHHWRRGRVLEAYGGKCVCCGESERVFLAVDHVAGGGNAHRRSLSRDGKVIVGSSNFYRWLVKNKYPGGFQLLCHNCNFAKSHGGCPHGGVLENPGT